MELPAPNSRVAFVGPTRSGKTYLARSWLRHYDHVAILDPKKQFSFESTDPRFRQIATTFKQFTKLMERSEKTGWPVIYRPPADDLNPMNADRLDRFYWYCLSRGNTLTYVDELYFLANGNDFAKRVPYYFRTITTGASLGVGAWSAFQRPAWIPKIALTETEVRAIFYLRSADDRDAIDRSFGEVAWTKLQTEQHSFVLSTDQWTSRPMRVSVKTKGSDIGSTAATRPVP